MSGYDEIMLVSELMVLFHWFDEYCINRSINTIILQIARGRSAEQTIKMLHPVLQQMKTKLKIKTVYRSNDYFQENITNDFIYITLGMVARFSDIKPGQLVIPTNCLTISDTPKDLKISRTIKDHNPDTKLLFEKFNFLLPARIVAILDNFPMITSNDYDLNAFASLFDDL